MATTFIFEDVNKTIRVEVKTDLMRGDSNSAFTIMDLVDLGDEEIALGIDLNTNVYNRVDLVNIANKLDLKLTSVSEAGEIVHVGFAGIYYNGGLGVDNL